MSGYWPPSEVGIDPADYATDQVPVKSASGLFAPGTPSGGGGGGLTRIAKQVLASAGTISFTNIPDTYDALLFAGNVRGADSAGSEQLRVRVGNTAVDTASDYAYFMHWDGVASSDQHYPASSPASSWSLGIIPAATDSISDAFAPFELRILEYATSARNRAGLWHSVNPGTSYRESHGAGHWLDTTDVVDVVEFFGLATPNLAAGSYIELWGI